MIRRSAFPALAALLFAQPAWAAREQPASLDLGRDLSGGQCIAARSWENGRGGIKLAAEQPWTITCRGLTSARAQGYVLPVTKDAGGPVANPVCGAAVAVTATGEGRFLARKCLDARLQLPVVELSLIVRGARLTGAAVPSALQPLARALRTMAGIAGADPLVVDLAALPAPETLTADAAPGPREVDDVQAALRQATVLLHSGQFVEASRLLNNATSETTDAPLPVQAQLRLNAGLANSNISQFESADEHFAIAAALIDRLATSDLKSQLVSRQRTYRSLDRINRKQWDEALRILEGSASGKAPLEDPAMLSQLNQAAQSGGAAALGIAQSSSLEALVLEVQKHWARSTALLAKGDIPASQAALDAGVGIAAALQRSVARDDIVWLRIGLQRQQARILVRAGRTAEALDSYGCALSEAQGTSVAGPLCRFGELIQRTRTYLPSGSVVGDIEMERASVRARMAGQDPASVIADYERAVDALAAAPGASGGVPSTLAPYLELLSAEMARAPDPATADRFFRAMQIAGEPGIARELLQLQSALSANGDLAAKVRNRADLQRDVTRLNFQIADQGDGEMRRDMERQRQAALSDLVRIEGDLQQAGGFQAIDDRPVPLDDLRKVLGRGEVYFKLATIGPKTFAIAASREQSFIYPLAAPAVDVEALAAEVLGSARSFHTPSGETRVRPFHVASAYRLYLLLSGPARELLASARSVIYDPAGALRSMPAAILVTSDASVDRYRASKNRNDYSAVAFLGAQAELATALSPRSFLLVRSRLAASAAPKAFAGLGENALAPIGGALPGDGRVNLGGVCRVAYAEWAPAFNGNEPISREELLIAARALGVTDPRIVSGSDFSNGNIRRLSASGELARYRVLHFATHGIPATRYKSSDCEGVLPPSLITTLLPPTGPDSDSSGLLPFQDVARLHLDANLVVLSACETAGGVSLSQGRLLAGQEDSTPTLDGLVRSFLAANARAVMATFWRVPDSSDTREMLAQFYGVGRTGTIGASLLAAQRLLIEKPSTSHPYFWGAYFVVGDGQKSMLGTANSAQVAER